MEELVESTVPTIEVVYDTFTPTEKEIANFFINNNEVSIDLSSKTISNLIHVSEASLTRFAKKCGFSGYREFIYDYQTKGVNESSTYQSKQMKRVLNDYNKILDKTYNLVETAQIERFATRLAKAKKVYIYGKGSSGIAATEMKIRFMRLGLPIEAITDDDIMLVNHVLVDEESVVIGFSISGKPKVVKKALKQANQKGAYTVLFTTQLNNLEEQISEMIPVASVRNLSYGNRISPQLPLLIIIDIIYDYFMEVDNINKDLLFNQSLQALETNIDE